ncbi:MAG: hypothetical protein JEZ07_18740 [Phycisphaerae bacterium]|nr:hypothetical protein [Phycisphaerae bacterium]
MLALSILVTVALAIYGLYNLKIYAEIEYGHNILSRSVVALLCGASIIFWLSYLTCPDVKKQKPINIVSGAKYRDRSEAIVGKKNHDSNIPSSYYDSSSGSYYDLEIKPESFSIEEMSHDFVESFDGNKDCNYLDKYAKKIPSDIENKQGGHNSYLHVLTDSGPLSGTILLFWLILFIYTWTKACFWVALLTLPLYIAITLTAAIFIVLAIFVSLVILNAIIDAFSNKNKSRN